MSVDSLPSNTLSDAQRRRVFAEHLRAAINVLDMRNAYRGPMSPDRAILTSLLEYLDRLPSETGLGQPDRLMELENEVAEAHDLISEFDSEIASGNVPDRLGDLFEKLRPSQKADEGQS